MEASRILGLVLCMIASSGVYARGQTRMVQTTASGEDERAATATMTREQLAGLARDGDYEHASAAVKQLLKDGGIENNFDLLMGIAKAKNRGDMIVERMTPHAADTSDPVTKARVDAYLDFLEQQMKAPAAAVVRPRQAVRSMARTVYWSAAEDKRRPGDPPPQPRYQHLRVLADLIGCLKDPRREVSDEAVSWVANVGGYAMGPADAIPALQAYRQAVAAQPAANQKEQEQRLQAVDRAIECVSGDQQSWIVHRLNLRPRGPTVETPQMGTLGYPIGTYLTIEGHRDDTSPNPDSYVIDRVNGAQFQKPVNVSIQNLHLPRPDPSERCVINGYELSMGRARPQPPRGAAPPPIAAHSGFIFWATSVREPADLRVAETGG